MDTFDPPAPRDLYRPPRPRSLSALAALARAAVIGDGNLLELLPAEAYRMKVGHLGYSRRSILIINAPELTRDILTDPLDIYPKNDLMTGALEPLVGDSIFVSSGASWRQQRHMIDPAFSHIRLNRAFVSMAAAVDDYEASLAGKAQQGEPVSLDLAMSHLTADVITRTVFSTSLKTDTAREVFDAFTEFERHVSHVEIWRLIFDPAFKRIPHKANVLAACERIRHHLGDLVDSHTGPGGQSYNDIASAIINARAPTTDQPFTREELIDQLGVFFLAGHETTASVLTWVFFILAMRGDVRERMRAEVEAVAGKGPVDIDQTKRMSYIRNVFKETLRLYPPITFIPRVAAAPCTIGPYKVKRGAMLMIAPWTIHRHQLYWKNPDHFDPDRFSPARESELIPNTYIPFGWGPRVCVGAAFATTEATLILARLVRRFDFEVMEPDKVRPVARLTTRPAEQIMCRVRER